MPGGHRGDRFGRFHQNHPWAIDGQINAGECFRLTALDIDFQKVDLTQRILPKNRIERPDFHRAHLAGKPMLRGNRCRPHVERRQSRIAHKTKLRIPFGIGNGNFQIDVARTITCQLREIIGVRFDIDAGPTAVVKPLGDRIHRRILCANVNVRASLHILQNPTQHHVRKILRIADHRWRQLSGRHAFRVNRVCHRMR